MNEGYFLGQVIDIGKFKFIYGKDLRHKAMIEITVKLVDKEILIFRGYDDIADDILKNKFKFVYILGQLRTTGYIEIKEIGKI